MRAMRGIVSYAPKNNFAPSAEADELQCGVEEVCRQKPAAADHVVPLFQGVVEFLS
jgi:hypothetical protein